jgi:nucleotide-binding universal stress UspA family protein
MLSVAQTPVVPALKNILFATDFSPCSEAAFRYVRAIAERYSSTVHLIHVLAPEPMLEIPLDRYPEMDADRESALSAMNALAAAKPYGKFTFTTTVARGPLWEVLAAFIEERSIDLIILGTHGRRGLKKVLLGSVAEQVFRLASCPVLTVGPETTREEKVDANFATILFTTDFSAGSGHALPYALSLARANKSHLVLFHAVPACREGAEELVAETILRTGEERVAELLSEQVRQELKPEIVVTQGAAADGILRVAENKHADLIVMGARRAALPAVATHLPWATASKVVCHAHCPVLTVRS